MSKTAVVGTNADFTINANGYIAQFVTDAGDPALLNIPGGNWNFEMFFSASSGGGSPSFYVQLYKYDGTTLTLIASGSAVPESITGGTSIDLYVTALAVPTTTLTLTDRLAIRVYVTHSGRTITLHTQDSHLCQIITTFTTGLTALNGLTAQVQNFAVGAGGSDFNISSVIDTHTFNLPTASATKRGALSSIDWSAFDAKVDFGDLSATSPLSYNGSGVFTIAQSSTSTNGYLSSTDWNTFNNKQNALTNPVTGTGTTNYVTKWISGSAVGNSLIYDDGTNVGIGTTYPTQKLHVVGSQYTTGNITVGASGNYSNVNFTRSDGAAVGGIGWRSDGIFYVGGHPDYGSGAGNDVRVYGFGANLFLGNSTSGDVLTITNAGKVGIGTTSPGAKLEVASSSSGTTILVGRAVGNSNIKALSDNGGFLALDSAGIGNALILNHYTSDNIWMVTGGGNVLINTTTDAGYKLDVNGTARVSSSLTAGLSSVIGTQLTLNALYANGIEFINTNAGVDNRNFRIISDQSVYGDFQIQKSTTQGGSTYANLLSFAQSGAATFSSSVTAKGDLLIWGGNAAQSGFITGNSAGGGLYIAASGTNQNIRLVPSGTGFVQVIGALDVSLGVTAVGALFTSATETRGTIRTTFTGDNSYYSLFSNDGALTLDTYGVGGSIYLKILGSTKLIIAASGNLLLGTATDSGYKLDVNGIAKVSGAYLSFNDNGYIRGDATGWLQLQGGTNGFRVMSSDNGSPYLTIANSTGAATFSSSVTATTFTASNRTILAIGGVYDNQANGNNIGIAFGSSTIISTTGDGTYSAQNLGSATFPWNNITAKRGIFQGSTGETLTAQGILGEWTANFRGAASTGNSYGLGVFAGTNINDIAFAVYNQAITTEFFIIKGNGTSYFNGGNVGIGTSSPSSPLEITSSGSAGGGFSMYNSAYSASKAWGMRTYGIDNTTGIHWATDVQFSSTWHSAIRIGHGQNAGNPSLQTYYSTYLATDGGNVGVKTSSPLAILSVGAGSLADTNVPIQISSEGVGTQKWIGINKNGNYGLILGYTENGGLGGNGAYIRQVASDPMFFVVNSTTVALTLANTGAATFSSSVTATSFSNAGLQSGEVFNATKSNAGYFVAYLQNSSASGYGLYIQNGSNSLPAIRISNAAGTVNAINLYGSGIAEFSSSVTATNFIVPGGTSAQFLKADGSLDSNVYLTSTSSTFSYTANLTLTTSFQNTGVSSANLGTGAYLVTCNANDFGVGGGQYDCTYTGLMYFFAGATNGSDANEIVLHHTGHADNGRYIYLRTLNTVGADGKTYLQISGNGTNSGASNYQLTFKKLL
jgi:hypothetical protein